MKKIIILLVLAFVFQIYSQPIKIWEKSFNWGGNVDNIVDMYVENNNVYIAGFNSTEDFSTYTVITKAALAKIRDSVVWVWIDTANIEPMNFNGDYSGFYSIVLFNNQVITSYTRKNTGEILKFSTEGLLLEREALGGSSARFKVKDGKMFALVKKFPWEIRIYDENDNLTNIIPVNSPHYFYRANLDVLNNYIVVAGSDNVGKNWNGGVCILLLDFSGNLIWRKHFDDCLLANSVITEEGIYLGYTTLEDTSQRLVTIKFDYNGNIEWQRIWDGDPTPGTYVVCWTGKVLAYPEPKGGCIHLGAIPQNGSQVNENKTDFGLIAYDKNGNVIWKMRFRGDSTSLRNDLYDAEWDEEGYLWLGGLYHHPAYDGQPRQIYISKWKVPGITSISENYISIPKEYSLYQNYPNPFNSETVIEFDLPEKVNVKLVVYDVLGQEVAVLVDGEMNEGRHRVKFDAGNLPSGVYIYELRSGRYRSVKKMVLVK